jgi:Ras GTPase-activating-like protein IQGAP2/3
LWFKGYWLKEENIQKLRKCQSQARSWLEKKRASRTEAISKGESPQHLDNKHTSTAEDKVSLKQQTVDEEFIIKLQSASRRYLSCIGYQRIIKSYRSDVKAQSFAKNKVMGNAYRKLSSVKNPSIDTVRTYIHLLDDDAHDFEREIASEELSQKLIENIRENNQLDTYINSLDIQIALFLKNAISIDEVLKHSGAFKKKKEHQRRLNELTSKNTQLNPFTLTGIDKESRQRLETYQKLVYLLQTEPKYLARLLSMTNRQDLGHFSSHRLIESTVLSVFGYATNAREEYLLINLCKVITQKKIKVVNQYR